MPITGKIQSLFSDIENTTQIFPRTKVKAISDDNGVGLNALLENLPYYSDSESSTATTVPMDADTLGGTPANEYLCQQSDTSAF